MNEMSVEEAVAYWQEWLNGFGSNCWWSKGEVAIKVILDELKALQECSSCKCDPKGGEG